MKITILRRFFQLISFILIVYISIFFVKEIEIKSLPFIKPAPGFAPEERIELLKAPAGFVQTFDTYLPAKSCRFIAGEGRLFRACFFHFLQESLSWLTPLKYVLPHLLLFIVLAFLLGRFWCGWLCPLGFISDVLGIMRKNLKLAYIELPKIFQDFLIKFKYLLLSLLILISLAIAAPIATALGISAFQKELFLPGCQICPGRILFPALGGHSPIFYSFDSPILIFFSLIGLFFLFVFLAGFFVRRIWCRFCPSGVLISFFNLGGAMIKEKDVQKCTRCGNCLRSCPLQNKNVYEEKINKNVNNRECIFCLRCLETCPEDGCLKVKFFGKKLFESKFKK